MEEKNEKVFSRLAVLIITILVMAIAIGGSYAIINYKTILSGDNSSSITTCSLNMQVSDEEGINLLNTYPMSDEDAINKITPYTFTIGKSSGSCKEISYKITMIDSCNLTDKISPDLIKYQLKNNTTNEEYLGINPYKMNVTGIVNEDTNYSLKLWLSEDAVNDDVYILDENGNHKEDENGNHKEDENGNFLTKSFCTKVQTEVVAK